MRSAIWALAILVGALGTQVVSLMQQYHQRLGGSAQELQRVFKDFDVDATASNLTRQQAIDQMAADAKPFPKVHAARYQGYLTRLERLERQERALAGPLPSALRAFITDHDSDLLKKAYENFSAQLSMSGVLVGIMSMTLLILTFELLAGCFWVRRQLSEA